MFYGLFAPQAALESMFGASFNGQLEALVIRSWSALVGVIGVMLIFGAFSPQNRVCCAMFEMCIRDRPSPTRKPPTWPKP